MTVFQRTQRESTCFTLSSPLQGFFHFAWFLSVPIFLGLGVIHRGLGAAWRLYCWSRHTKDATSLGEWGTFPQPHVLCLDSPLCHSVFFESACLMQWQGPQILRGDMIPLNLQTTVSLPTRGLWANLIPRVIIEETFKMIQAPRKFQQWPSWKN